MKAPKKPQEFTIQEGFQVLLLDNSGGVVGTHDAGAEFPDPEFIKQVLLIAHTEHGKQITAKIDKRFFLVVSE